ncbi:MAG: DNA mismatch repair protein MutS [Deltaproteobacteria bacterium]|nr:MAG: DNA mismatch repair protein MutS [Deltaproteobacteria bacterium]
MLAQYLRLKERHRDAILMFRLGDFYEMFFEDAERASAILDITLTARNKHDATPIPLCGVPFHSVEPYIQKLLGAGLKVAICEQVEDPRAAKGLVDRDVVRVITPGTIVEEESLDPRTASFLAVLGTDDRGYALAIADISTGEVRVAEFGGDAAADGAPHDDLVEAVGEEIARLGVKELVLSAAAQPIVERLTARAPGVFRSLIPDEWYDAGDATAWLAGVGAAETVARPGALAALGALRAYLRETYRGTLDHLRPPELYHPRETLVLDHVTRTNLALTHGASGETRGSLLAVLDRTTTPMGSRTLRRWLLAPLTSCAAIGRRLDAVETLVEQPGVRADVRAGLAGMGDVERLVGRIGTATATPRDMARLASALERVENLRARLADATDLLGEVGAALSPLPGLRVRIAALLVDDPPAALRGGPVVRDGFHPEVDELRAAARDGRGWVAAFEARERARTGIGSLKIRYNRVFGYAIEVTKPNLALVPADYVRKQTLAGAERFVTQELKDHERRLLGAEERLRQLETELFAALVTDARAEQRALAENARALGVLDTVAALAELAHDRGYVRPFLDRGDAVVIRDGRHPIVETVRGADRFVPNDCVLDETQQILLITGPNMAGKSTYLRQVALIVVMAQMGSFVPAVEARVGVVDRIFTRVGASDDLAAGDSTFMVEMRETAHILRELTDRSLVVLDEIGRGTSTFDGIAIAWAVAEHLHERGAGAKTLFATHYYELTALAREKARIRNYSVAVREWQGEIIFLRRIVPGPASRSYGIEVARLAGLPTAVLERARGLLAALERGEMLAEDRRAATTGSEAGEPRQLGLFGSQLSAVERRLRELDVARMTPIDALNELHGLVEAVRGGGDHAQERKC